MRKVLISAGDLEKGDQVVIPPKTKTLIGEFQPNRSGSITGTLISGASGRSVTLRPNKEVSVGSKTTHLVVSTCHCLEALYAEVA